MVFFNGIFVPTNHHQFDEEESNLHSPPTASKCWRREDDPLFCTASWNATYIHTLAMGTNVRFSNTLQGTLVQMK